MLVQQKYLRDVTVNYDMFSSMSSFTYRFTTYALIQECGIHLTEPKKNQPERWRVELLRERPLNAIRG